jgi:formamidopyrimidine-DNA glycosylase
MPELPEVETVVRTLAAAVTGQRVKGLRYLAARAAAGTTAPDLAGQRIGSVRRKGKHILLDLDKGLLDIHLRMTGKLRVGGEIGPYTRAVLELSSGHVSFEDVRQFGFVVWREKEPALGRDALSVDRDEFVEMVRGWRGRIKPALLDQRKLAGLGNIYVDEALYRAGVHPLARGARLTKPRLRQLWAEMRAVLEEAIAAGGSSISDYEDALGQRGNYQQRHQVYGREGDACPRCGVAIRRIVVAQRGTHFCPACQRR